MPSAFHAIPPPNIQNSLQAASLEFPRSASLNLLTDFPHKCGSIFVSGKNRQTGSPLPHICRKRAHPLTHLRIWGYVLPEFVLGVESCRPEATSLACWH